VTVFLEIVAVGVLILANAIFVAAFPYVVLGELAPKSLAIATRVRGVLVEELRFEARAGATEPA
jgi:CBS domain containing-hemolysin-like protein